MASRFDPTHAVRFDLPRGKVHAGSEERYVLVPAAALEALTKSGADDAAASVGRTIGDAIGRRVALRADAKQSSVEEFVTQLAGEVALAGLGVASVERWGRAMVLVFEEAAVSDAMLSAIAAAALESATRRKVCVAPIMREGATARLLVSSERAVGRVREWIASGVAWKDALFRLHTAVGGAP
jgi:hypothetical protein